MFNSDEQRLLREQAGRICTTAYRDRVQQSLFLRTARDDEERAYLLRLLVDARAAWKARETVNQRRWQSNVSRRPARGRHHDSWAIREQYVRGGTWGDYLAVARELGAPTRP